MLNFIWEKDFNTYIRPRRKECQVFMQHKISHTFFKERNYYS